MNEIVVARLKIPKVIAATLQKGQDGATWHSGDVKTVMSCKNGDYCFNPDTFDIYKCIGGGNADISQWEWICNLNNLDKINDFLNSSRQELQKLIDSVIESPAYKPWWFGTREEYNSISEEERNIYDLHFIEEGT